MSRVICINDKHDNIVERCRKHNIGISMIETLESGGTRVVLNNVKDVEALGAIYGSKVLTGTVTRTDIRSRRYGQGVIV